MVGEQRLQLMAKVAKIIQTLSSICGCQDSKASTRCLQAFSKRGELNRQRREACQIQASGLRHLLPLNDT